MAWLPYGPARDAQRAPEDRGVAPDRPLAAPAGLRVPSKAIGRRWRYVSGRINDWVKKTCAMRETLAIAGFALDGNKWDGAFISPGRRAKSWSTPARSTTALTPHQPRICRRGSSR